MTILNLFEYSKPLSSESITRFQLGAGALLFVVFLGLYLSLAWVIPDRFSVDGYLNYGATQYLAKQVRIPVVDADDPEIVFSQVGATRSLRPPLTYILNAASYRLFGEQINDRKVAMRLGSTLLGASIVLIAYLAALIAGGSAPYAMFLACLVGLMPRFTILASSNNDDIGAIGSVSFLFLFALLLSTRPTSLPKLFGLAFSIGLVLQTKFTAWLCLPWVFLALAPQLWQARGMILRWAPVLLVTLIVAGGWWPLFNMVNYGLDDPTALQHAAKVQFELTGTTQNREGYWSHGVTIGQLLQNHDDFLTGSLASVVGELHWIRLPVTAGLYWYYALCLVLVSIGFFQVKRVCRWLPTTALLLAIVSQWGFYLHHNLLRDTQPDGRYLMPLLVPLTFLCVVGFAYLLHRIPTRSVRTENWIVAGFNSMLIALVGHNFMINWMPNGLA